MIVTATVNHLGPVVEKPENQTNLLSMTEEKTESGSPVTVLTAELNLKLPSPWISQSME